MTPYPIQMAAPAIWVRLIVSGRLKAYEPTKTAVATQPMRSVACTSRA
jgi:hypothetical protein